jgi:hypothetical protein
MKQYRQGDILLREVKELPKNIKKLDHKVLAYGEATGHRHQVINGELYENDQKRMYLQVRVPTIIEHEEHDPLELPAAIYEVIRQKEYKSEDMTELVVD